MQTLLIQILGIFVLICIIKLICTILQRINTFLSKRFNKFYISNESNGFVSNRVMNRNINIRQGFDLNERDFMVLRYYCMNEHPVKHATKKYKVLYFSLIKELINNLYSYSLSFKAAIDQLFTILELDTEQHNLLSSNSHINEMDFKCFSKKEIACKGFLKYSINDYRYLLILEAIYFRYIINRKIDYDTLDIYCKLLRVKLKNKEIIAQYLKYVFEDGCLEIKAFLKRCKDRYIYNSILFFHNNVYYSIVNASMPKYNVVVCATMSSGKSTFINALLGKDYIPAKNEACTAKITSIRDNDSINNVIGIMINRNKNKVERTNVDLATLQEWNNDECVEKIVLESNLSGIRANKKIVVMHDTPGTNYSQDNRHSDITLNFIRTSKIDMVIYIINAEHVSTTDNQILLKQIKAEVIDKQRSKIIFLVNKIDSFDIEKSDDIHLCLREVKQELIRYGYIEPIVLPVSANAARLFKMVLKEQNLSKKEIAQFRSLFDLFFSQALDLTKYAEYERNYKFDYNDGNSLIKVGDLQFKKADLYMALEHTGITLVEKIIDNILNNNEGRVYNDQSCVKV